MMLRQGILRLTRPYYSHYARHANARSGMSLSTDAKSGVMGSLRGAYDTAVASREEQSKEKIFATQMKFLSSRTPVTPQVFLQLLDEIKLQAGFGGVKRHLPWVANNEVVKDFEQQEGIIKALTPAEQTSLRALPISAKKRVARATDSDLLTVESIFSQISSMRLIQKRLLGCIERGERLPKSSEELKIMIASSSAGRRVQMPKPGVKQKRGASRW